MHGSERPCFLCTVLLSKVAVLVNKALMAEVKRGSARDLGGTEPLKLWSPKGPAPSL
jgi:hypothetical protein